MKFFIGIVPPEDIYNAVADIQKRFGDNRLEPHITLRPPVIMTEEEKWIKAIEEVCSRFLPFNIELPCTGYFGKRVLFINVYSDKLHDLYQLVIEATKPFERPEVHKQENEDYHPHLTLGRSWCGFSKDDFVKMKALADNYLSAKKTSFIVNSVRVYHKPSATGRYAPQKDISLNSVSKK